MSCIHDTSTPYRPETNGIAERAVRRVKEGTSASLVQSGLPEDWWGEAMYFYCLLRCVYDQLQDRKTAFEKRSGQPLKDPISPFGAQIEYKPSRDKDIQKLHQLGKKMLSGIFLGYEQQAGGGWSGDLMVADWQQIETAGLRSDIHINRFKAEEIEVVKRNDRHVFPITEGNLFCPRTQKRP